MCAYDRVGLVAALWPVSYAVVFDEETPERLIQVVRPQVYVKGCPYTREMLPEGDLVESLGGKVMIFRSRINLSTTQVITRIDASRAVREAARLRPPTEG